VEKKVFDGDPEQDEVWNKLDAYLLTEFRREDGVPMRVDRCFVDMQFKNQRVLAFCAARLGRGVYPCRGLNRVGATVPPLLPPKPTRNNRARIPHWNIGVTVAKSTIYDRLQLPIPGPRSMHFPLDPALGYDADYFRQLTAEKRRTRYSYGQPYSIFEKDHAGVRNEALDLNVYALGALYSRMPINWAKLAENLAALKPKDAEAEAREADMAQPAPQPASVLARPVRRNFATAW
jgi:phage terminase large subunit GpA-like protein